jgi:hypothetical protein
MSTFESIKSELEARKEYPIEGKPLWFIRNFLSQEEIDFLMQEANDPQAWYITKRSPWPGAIRNKFLQNVPEYMECGTLKLPTSGSPERPLDLFKKPITGIDDRCRAVLPETFAGISTFQSVFSAPEEVVKESAPKCIELNYTMPWHAEEDPGKNQGENIEGHPVITASFSLYLNDDFEGGELMFRNFPNTVIKPEPGMLINIPLTREFTHKVAYVSSGVRHSLYGLSWSKLGYIESTNETC